MAASKSPSRTSAMPATSSASVAMGRASAGTPPLAIDSTRATATQRINDGIGPPPSFADALLGQVQQQLRDAARLDRHLAVERLVVGMQHGHGVRAGRQR